MSKDSLQKQGDSSSHTELTGDESSKLSLSELAKLDRAWKIQLQELKLKERELEISERQEAFNRDFAELTVKAEAKDREGAREAENIRHRRFLITITIVSFLALSFFSIALFLDKEMIVIEFFKAAAFIFTGGLAGKYLEKQQSEKKEQDKAP